MSKWSYKEGDETHGPMSAAELRALVASGRVRPDTLITKEGLGAWVHAKRVKGLFPAANAQTASSAVEPSAESATSSEGARAEAVAQSRPADSPAPVAGTGEAPAAPAPSAETTRPSRSRITKRVRLIVVAAVAAVLLAAVGTTAVVMLTGGHEGTGAPALGRPAASSGSQGTEVVGATQSPGPTSTPQGRTERNDQASGDTEAFNATSGDFEVTVLDFRFRDTLAVGVSDLTEAPRAKGSFLWFALRITNTGSTPSRIAPDSITLRDGQGRTFEPGAEAMAYIALTHDDSALLDEGGIPWLTEFQPGVPTKVQVAFDVPRPAQAARQAAGEAGYELVLDLGLLDGVISAARMSAAIEAARQAYNEKFDRLMAAYDGASAPEPPIKSFKVTFGRPRIIGPSKANLGLPSEPEGPPDGGVMGRLTGANSMVGFFSGTISVCGNGLMLEPGWQQPPKAQKAPEVPDAPSDTLPLPVSPDAQDETDDPRRRLERLRRIREEIPDAVVAIERQLGLAEGPTTTDDQPAADEKDVNEGQEAQRGETARGNRASRTKAHTRSFGSDGSDPVQRLLESLRSAPWLADQIPGAPEVLAGRDGPRRQSRDDDPAGIRSVELMLTSDSRQSALDGPKDPVPSVRRALAGLDMLSGQAKLIMLTDDAATKSMVQEDQRATTLEASRRSERSFLPFVVGWFRSDGKGTLLQRVGDVEFAPTVLDAPRGPQEIGLGMLEMREIGWLREASVPGSPTSECPQDLSVERSMVLVDPQGFPVIAIFESPEDREAFLAQLRDTALAWGEKWRTTADEYKSLGIGTSVDAGVRVMELRKQGRNIDLMSRATWELP